MISELPINQQFKIYLFTSYLYYKEDVSAIKDNEFDMLCNNLLKNWDNITHYHKNLINKSDLEAGTGFAIQYPTIVIGAAKAWYRDRMGIKRYE